MMARTSDVCLFTVATEHFVPGAFVMIGTFLKHHPGFDGDVVVVQDGLSAASREMLRAAFGRLRFEAVSPELKGRVERLDTVRHLFRYRTASLYYLEAFRLTGYRKVLCCDSDLLFQGCIAELFDSTEALLCCGDRWFLRGQPLDAATGLPVPEPGRAGPGQAAGGRGTSRGREAGAGTDVQLRLPARRRAVCGERPRIGTCWTGCRRNHGATSRPRTRTNGS